MKLFTVEFNGMYPVPHGLVILAETEEDAKVIVEKTVLHTREYKLCEISLDYPGVVFYESGDY